MRFKGHQFFIAAAKQDGWGERILSGLATAAVQGRHTSDFLFGSTERNKITEVLLRWAVISEHFLGGLAAAAPKAVWMQEAPGDSPSGMS